MKTYSMLSRAFALWANSRITKKKRTPTKQKRIFIIRLQPQRCGFFSFSFQNWLMIIMKSFQSQHNELNHFKKFKEKRNAQMEKNWTFWQLTFLFHRKCGPKKLIETEWPNNDWELIWMGIVFRLFPTSTNGK